MRKRSNEGEYKHHPSQHPECSLHFHWIDENLLSLLPAAAGKLIMKHIKDVTLSAVACSST